MIEPPPPAIIDGNAARHSRNEPVRLTANDPLPIGEAGLQHGACGIVRCGTADQDVEPAKGVVCRFGRGPRLALAGNVAIEGERLPARRFDEPHGLGRPGQIDVAAGDRRSSLGERKRDRPPDAARRTADQRRLAAEGHSAAFLANRAPVQPQASVCGSIRCIRLRSAASGITSPTGPAEVGSTRPHTSTPSTMKYTIVSMPIGSTTSSPPRTARPRAASRRAPR